MLKRYYCRFSESIVQCSRKSIRICDKSLVNHSVLFVWRKSSLLFDSYYKLSFVFSIVTYLLNKTGRMMLLVTFIVMCYTNIKKQILKSYILEVQIFLREKCYIFTRIKIYIAYRTREKYYIGEKKQVFVSFVQFFSYFNTSSTLSVNIIDKMSWFTLLLTIKTSFQI